jgi:hypothetical protein
MLSKDWMYHGYIENRDQAQRTLSYIENPEHRDDLGFAKTTKAGKFLDNEVMPRYRRFDAAVSAWKPEETRNAVINLEVKEAQEDFVPVYRTIYNMLKGSLEVSNADLQAMGLPPRPSGDRTPAKIEDEAPDVETDTSVPGEVTMHFFKKGQKRGSAKPDGQHGVECKTYIGPDIPKKWKDLQESWFSTNLKLVLKFENDRRGQILWFAVRWENTRGQKGPWSVIFSVIIP